MKQCLCHPEMMEKAPEKVYFNQGVEYHSPKPEGVFQPPVKEEATVSA